MWTKSDLGLLCLTKSLLNFFQQMTKADDFRCDWASIITFYEISCSGFVCLI